MGRFPFEEPPTVTLTKCPPRVQSYDPATMKKLGAELTELRSRDPKAVAPDIIDDYAKLLNACRAYEHSGAPRE